MVTIPEKQESSQTQRFDKAAIASLTTDEIEELNEEELVEVISNSDLPENSQSAIIYKQPHMLKKLAFLARRSCQNQGH